MLLAVGKGSGSFEVWICDVSNSKFDKFGSYDAHDNVVSFVLKIKNKKYPRFFFAKTVK